MEKHIVISVGGFYSAPRSSEDKDCEIMKVTARY